jgi:Ras-related protein Rab-2A
VDWLKEIRLNASGQLEIIIIGNKTDLESEREVSAEEGRKFAVDNNLQWIELSAKEYGKV